VAPWTSCPSRPGWITHRVPTSTMHQLRDQRNHPPSGSSHHNPCITPGTLNLLEPRTVRIDTPLPRARSDRTDLTSPSHCLGALQMNPILVHSASFILGFSFGLSASELVKAPPLRSHATCRLWTQQRQSKSSQLTSKQTRFQEGSVALLELSQRVRPKYVASFPCREHGSLLLGTVL
jgi:hypothetical protein